MTAATVPATPPVAAGYAAALAAFLDAVEPETSSEVTVGSLRDATGPAFAWFSSLVEDRHDVDVRAFVLDDGEGPPLQLRGTGLC